MGKTDFLKKCVITTVGRFPPEFTPENMKRWIESRKGVHSTSLTEETTLVVAAEEYWNRQGGLVVQALKRKDVKIVSLDWLVESLKDGRKHGLTKYDWTKLDKASMKKSKPKPVASNKRKSAKGHYANALLDHTKQFAGSADTSRDETSAEAPAVDSEAPSAEKRARQTFGRGTKNAKFDVGSDKHHVYQDSTGFRYEVTLFKVEVSQNWNERAIITVYESHSKPSTYACHFKSTNSFGAPDADSPKAIGANYETAMSCFKTTFEEKTGMAWDDRFERCERRKPGRPAPVTFSNSGFVTPHIVIAAGGARDPDAPPEDEKLRREFNARLLSYRTPLENEPQGDLPPDKMGFNSMTQAAAGALEDFDPSQHKMSIDEIIGASSDNQETTPTAESNDGADGHADEFDMMTATDPNPTEKTTPAGMEPRNEDLEDQEMMPAMPAQCGHQAIEDTSESQADEQEEMTNLVCGPGESQSVDQETAGSTEPQLEHEKTMNMPAVQIHELEPTASQEPQSEGPEETTIAATQSVDQEMVQSDESQLEHEEPPTVPARQIQEQEPTAPQELQTEGPELTAAVAQPAKHHAIELKNGQMSSMTNTTAEDIVDAQNERQTPQYEPAFPGENTTGENMIEIAANVPQIPQYEPALPDEPVDKAEEHMEQINEDE